MTTFAFTDGVLAVDGRQTVSGMTIVTDTALKLRFSKTGWGNLVLWAFAGALDIKPVVEKFIVDDGIGSHRAPPSHPNSDYSVFAIVQQPGRPYQYCKFGHLYATASVETGCEIPYSNGTLGDVAQGAMLAGKSAADAVGIVSTVSAFTGPVVYSASASECFAAGQLIQTARHYYKNERGVLCSAACELDGTPLGAKDPRQGDLFERAPVTPTHTVLLQQSPLLSAPYDGTTRTFDPNVDYYKQAVDAIRAEVPDALLTDVEVAALRRAARAMGGV